jgi:hypothetical protein
MNLWNKSPRCFSFPYCGINALSIPCIKSWYIATGHKLALSRSVIVGNGANGGLPEGNTFLNKQSWLGHLHLANGSRFAVITPPLEYE